MSTLPPESWWERIFLPHLDALVGRAVSQLGQLVTQETAAVHDLAALIAGTGAGTGPAGTGVRGPQAILPVPLDALLVARLAMAAQIPGIASPQSVRQVLTVPAQGTATYTLTAAPGTVIIQVGRFQGATTIHDPTVTVTVFVDGLVTPLIEFPGTEDVAVTVPEYFPIRQQLVAQFTNPLPVPLVVTLTEETIIVDAHIYETVWLPLVQADYDLLVSLAQSLTAAEGGTGA
jgi:hypothetical protein